MKKSLATLLVLSSLETFSGCAHGARNDLKTLVFIQGVHLDASVWTEVKKQIDPEKYHVMDLGRTGRDGTYPASLKQIATLSCEEVPPRSILVGHSYGGAIANEMAGICPDKIAQIIYIAAVVPIQGEKPFDQMSKSDQESYAKAVDFKRTEIVPKEAKKFFPLTDPSVDLNGSLPALYTEWISLTSEPIAYDLAPFSEIPKAYIFTDKDPVLSASTQHLYVDRLKIKETDTVETGHFPMISDPVNLSKLILKHASDSK